MSSEISPNPSRGDIDALNVALDLADEARDWLLLQVGRARVRTEPILFHNFHRTHQEIHSIWCVMCLVGRRLVQRLKKSYELGKLRLLCLIELIANRPS